MIQGESLRIPECPMSQHDTTPLAVCGEHEQPKSLNLLTCQKCIEMLQTRNGPLSHPWQNKQDAFCTPRPGSFLRNTCWQAGDAEVEAEDLDEALADAWALRTYGQWKTAAVLIERGAS